MNSPVLKRACYTDWSNQRRSTILVHITALLTAINVPGKKTIVRIAIVFIAELSRLLAAAILFESRAIE